MKIILFITISILIGFCQSCNHLANKNSKMKVEDIICTEIGIDELRRVINKYQIPSEQIERKWIANKEHDNLFFHNLVYPYGVARKYYFEWISKEELIDISIQGYKKGINKYLEVTRDFRIGKYVVWWCQQSCIEFILKKIWIISVPLQNKFIPKEELQNIISKTNLEENSNIGLIREHYDFLFKIIEEKYFNTKLEFTNKDKNKIIQRAVNVDLSMESLMKDEYKFYKNELSFEDIILLEYCLLFENELKKDKASR